MNARELGRRMNEAQAQKIKEQRQTPLGPVGASAGSTNQPFVTPLGHLTQSPSQHPVKMSAMAPAVKYPDLPIVNPLDRHFTGPVGRQYLVGQSELPEFLDTYQDACAEGPVSAVESILAGHSATCTPAMLHHGLTIALAAGNIQTSSLLLSAGAPILDLTAENILSAPTADQQVALFDLLSCQGWATDQEHLFLRTITSPPLLRWFLDHGADPNHGIPRYDPQRPCGPDVERCAALQKAAYSGTVEAVQMLLDAGARIDLGTPLHSAAGAATPETFNNPTKLATKELDEGRIPVMELLVANGADVNGRQISQHLVPGLPIVEAINTGALARVKWLLDHGADPELAGPFGSAASHVKTKSIPELDKVIHEAVRIKHNSYNII